MKRSVLSLVAFLALSSSLFAQSTDPVLMTINGKPVLKSEFEYIYNKNNSNNSLDKKTLEQYVDLFVNFKLKVEEAKTQGIDTTKSFITELSGYRSQLTKPYLTDSKVDDATIREAYDRSKEDVDVSHILIRIPQNATPADTLKAWNDINAVWKRVQKEDFAKVAKEKSQDQSADQNSGHISWISAFRTVYPFETVAYNTPVGTISKPVRTAFGYHIIKVHGRRNSLGEVLISHIMTFTSKGDEAVNKKAKVTIDSIYARIKAGDDFGTLASKHSMDKGSSVKNGELPWFGTGRMVPEFETAAFALKNKGDYSEPIQSQYGWHILKLIDKKGLASYDELKADLERKIKRDERANRGQQAFLAKSRAENGYKLNAANLKEFYALLKPKSQKSTTTLTTKLSKLDISSSLVFASGKSALSSSAKKALIKFANELAKNQAKLITLYGYSDNIGQIEINQKISFDRAKEVANYLISMNVQASQIKEIIGKNAEDPIGDNSTIIGRSKNRRVDVYTNQFENNTDDKNKITDIKLSDSIFIAEAAKLDKPLFSVAGKNYSQADFAKYLKKNSASEKTIASEVINEKLDAFVDAELLAFEDTQLEKKYDDFRNLMQEYHDGILLFEVSNREVWDKASKDTKGLDKYFKAHKDTYKWEKPHYKGRIILCKDKETFDAAQKIVKRSAADSIEKYLRVRLNDSIQHVKVEKGLYVQGDNKIIDNQVFKTKDAFVPSKDYPLSFVVGELIVKPEDYADVRGLVTADYQEFLEQEWIKALRAKYQVKVNDDVLKTVKNN